jgi:hypothetical protein
VPTLLSRFWLYDWKQFAELSSELAKLPLDRAAFILDPKFREKLGKSQ